MQETLVGIIVAGAIWVVVKRFAPRTAQITARMCFARVLKNFGWLDTARKLEAAADLLAGASGCGGCGSCSTVKARPETKQFSITPEQLKRTARR